MKTKKRIFIILLSLIFVIAIIPTIYVLTKDNDTYADDYTVSGGVLEIDFSLGTELSQFSLYGEFGRVPYLMDEKMYFHSLEEEKAILNGYTFTDVDVRVTIGTLNDCGKFDSGIYVMASGAGNGAGVINGYNVNVEHAVGDSTYTVKLHQFVNGAWDGIKTEKSEIILQGNTVDLRVVVKSGTLYAFADDMETPLFSYIVGTGSGTIGFRNYYSPNWFDNLSVCGSTLVTDKSQLQSLVITAYQKVNAGNLTAGSTTALNNAITLAESATTKSEIDLATETINEALKNALVLRSYQELTQLIEEAELLVNDGYTQNSWNALQQVISISKTVSATDLESVSYWYDKLNGRIDGLIKYNLGGNA